MPIIEVSAFEHRFSDPAINAQLIRRLTEVFGEVYGTDVARQTQVILNGVSPSRWGIGGAPASTS
jgi:phenylpyruvate tautomerase PptA (4-oxalocrotonate tautomerase family)